MPPARTPSPQSKLTLIKREVIRSIDSIAAKLFEISLAIHSYAEPPYQEYKSSELLVSVLKENGFAVEKPLAGLETAFRGTFADGRGPTIAFTAEYDAIRVFDYKSDRIMGHACGHNLNAVASLGAALALRGTLSKLSGTIVLLGTPAEEELGRAGKITLIERGVFKDVDAAMMMHGTLYPPEQAQYFTSPHATNYLVSILFRFKGHRSVAGPGINALDPLHHFLHGLYMLERRFGQDVRLERIILRGGETPNAIPVEAVAKVWIRSKSRPLLEHAVAAVKKCATSSAEALGAECEVEPEGTVRSVVCNPTLEELAEKNARSLGLNWKSNAPLSAFSTDFGNVSAILPSFYLKVPLGVGRFHTCEAMTNTRSYRALKAMVEAIKLLSLIAVDLLATPQLIRKAHRELESYRETSDRRR